MKLLKKHWPLFLSLGLFIASLTQTAFYLSDSFGVPFALLKGWLGVVVDIGTIVQDIKALFYAEGLKGGWKAGATLSWLANPALLFAWIAGSKIPKEGLVLSSISLLLMLSFLAFDEVLADEAGHYRQIQSLALGYWLWVASALVLVVGYGYQHKFSLQK